MTPFWLLNVVVWGVVLAYMLPGAWCAAFGNRARRGDPMRLACLATAIVMLGFVLRWLLAPDSEILWKGLYILSAADGLYILMLARAYGRGPRVG